jgi:hypothetical protein
MLAEVDVKGAMSRPTPSGNDRAQLIAIFRGIASFAFFSVKVKTPSSSWAAICCWSILFDSVKARAK